MQYAKTIRVNEETGTNQLVFLSKRSSIQLKLSGTGERNSFTTGIFGKISNLTANDITVFVNGQKAFSGYNIDISYIGFLLETLRDNQIREYYQSVSCSTPNSNKIKPFEPIYGIAVLLLYWLMVPGIGSDQVSVKALSEKLTVALRRGYEQKMQLPEVEWTKPELFMRYYVCMLSLRMAFSQVHPECFVAGNRGMEKGLRDMLALLSENSIYDALQKRQDNMMQMVMPALKMMCEEPDESDPRCMALWEIINSPEQKPFIMSMMKSLGIEV